MNILAFDIGNTHLRYSIIDTKNLKTNGIHHASREDLDNIVNTSENIEAIGIASVSTINTIHTNIPIIYPTVQNISTLFFEYDTALLGIDRAIDALACSKLYPQTDCIIVDTGTATTVDLLTSSGKFIAGSIAPGIKLKLESLSEKTHKLPLVSYKNLIISNNPTNTEASISNGVIFDTIGGIYSMIDHLTQFASDTKIITCGGGWEYLQPFYKQEHFYIPELTLIGTALAVELALFK